MNDNERLTLGVLIALLLSLIISIPATYLKTKKLLREGKSIKNLPIKMSLKITIPILAIPVLLSHLSWLWKITAIVLAGLGGISYIIGIESAQKAMRQMLGLPPIDEDTGMPVKEEEGKAEDRRKHSDSR